MVFRHPSEKYEFVNWDDDIPQYEWEHKIHGNHSPPTSRGRGAVLLPVSLTSKDPTTKHPSPDAAGELDAWTHAGFMVELRVIYNALPI